MTTSSPGSDIDANRNCPMILIMFENVARKVTDSSSLMPVAPFNKIDGHALGSDHQPRVVVSLAVMSPPSSRASGSVMDIPAKTNSNPP